MNADLPILFFNDQAAWESWLKLNYTGSTGVLLKLAKKNTGITSVNYEQALESALCYGWIDSQISGLDRNYYLQKFSPRRPRSKWSRMNCEKAEELIAAGRMHTAGLKQVELAKADGRWEAAYDPQSRISTPADLQAELDKHPAAKDFFNSLNSQNRYAILYRIQDAKQTETRSRRIRQFVEMLLKKEKIYP